MLDILKKRNRRFRVITLTLIIFLWHHVPKCVIPFKSQQSAILTCFSTISCYKALLFHVHVVDSCRYRIFSPKQQPVFSFNIHPEQIHSRCVGSGNRLWHVRLVSLPGWRLFFRILKDVSWRHFKQNNVKQHVDSFLKNHLFM